MVAFFSCKGTLFFGFEEVVLEVLVFSMWDDHRSPMVAVTLSLFFWLVKIELEVEIELEVVSVSAAVVKATS